MNICQGGKTKLEKKVKALTDQKKILVREVLNLRTASIEKDVSSKKLSDDNKKLKDVIANVKTEMYSLRLEVTENRREAKRYVNCSNEREIISAEQDDYSHNYSRGGGEEDVEEYDESLEKAGSFATSHSSLDQQQLANSRSCSELDYIMNLSVSSSTDQDIDISPIFESIDDKSQQEQLEDGTNINHSRQFLQPPLPPPPWITYKALDGTTSKSYYGNAHMMNSSSTKYIKSSKASVPQQPNLPLNPLQLIGSIVANIIPTDDTSSDGEDNFVYPHVALKNIGGGGDVDDNGGGNVGSGVGDSGGGWVGGMGGGTGMVRRSSASR